MALPTVFISYNPASDIEQTLAVRLHTLGSVHGFNMLLPDRLSFGKNVSGETRNRILSSDFFILFSTSPLSAVVQEEIRIAYSKLHEKSKILVIYDLNAGENLQGADSFTKVLIDRTWPVEQIVEKIVSENKKIQKKGDTHDGFLSVLGPILLTGVALFLLSGILDDAPKRKKQIRPKRQPARKTTAKLAKKVRS
jgi:hypothetical protein